MFEALHRASMGDLQKGLKAIATDAPELESTSKEVQLLSNALDVALPVDGSVLTVLRNGMETRIELTHVGAQNL